MATRFMKTIRDSDHQKLIYEFLRSLIDIERLCEFEVRTCNFLQAHKFGGKNV